VSSRALPSGCDPRACARDPWFSALRSAVVGGVGAATEMLARQHVLRLLFPMDRATLIAALKSYDVALRENGATGLYIFGSRARGDHRPDSDLDLFIDYDPTAKVPNLFRLMQIEDELGKVLGVPVTITTRNALHPLMKDQIEREAVRVL
jgi:predicted nucleotidyltransferase